MPDNKQPIEYYVAEAKRLGLSEEQQSVIGDETDGDAFREHIANAHDLTDDELRELLTQEWDRYSADPKAAATSFDRDAEAQDEANGRHADSEPDEGWEDEDPEEDELDDEDDDFGSDVGEDDDDWDEDEEDFDSSSDTDGLESGDEPKEDEKSERGQTQSSTTVDTAPDFDSESLDHLDIDEDAIEQKRNGGGEALDDGEADCEGCKI
ncbi:hypothetical protein pEaSNUABM5_00034 [Erwinia phage pEa_SNUABM_5]|uniref:Uncharacterized protein n=1 Tax=Erwinia phage pEa_SNUABM_5 TaxID=2797313 RepID=A0A7T8EPA4_9CAUD|nr:hypothetical protein MPK73_gp034 [Erwinia phage pEa_SNUABM_5]QQO90176.1 hypothetical protein pEaSNUABM5_00034 [Erwinia phage pEa_SNUABM_5]